MTPPSPPNPETASPVEPDEVNTGVLLVTGSLLAVGVVLVALLLAGVVRQLAGQRRRGSALAAVE